MRRAEGVWDDDDECEKRQVAEQLVNSDRDTPTPPDPDLGPADQCEQAEQRHVVELLPGRVDGRQQAGDDGQCDIACPHGQLQALLLASFECRLGRTEQFRHHAGCAHATARQTSSRRSTSISQGSLLAGAVAAQWRPSAAAFDNLVMHGREVISSGACSVSWKRRWRQDYPDGAGRLSLDMAASLLARVSYYLDATLLSKPNDIYAIADSYSDLTMWRTGMQGNQALPILRQCALRSAGY